MFYTLVDRRHPRRQIAAAAARARTCKKLHDYARRRRRRARARARATRALAHLPACARIVSDGDNDDDACARRAHEGQPVQVCERATSVAKRLQQRSTKATSFLRRRAAPRVLTPIFDRQIKATLRNFDADRRLSVQESEDAFFFSSPRR